MKLLSPGKGKGAEQGQPARSAHDHRTVTDQRHVAPPGWHGNTPAASQGRSMGSKPALQSVDLEAEDISWIMTPAPGKLSRSPLWQLHHHPRKPCCVQSDPMANMTRILRLTSNLPPLAPFASPQTFTPMDLSLPLTQLWPLPLGVASMPLVEPLAAPLGRSPLAPQHLCAPALSGSPKVQVGLKSSPSCSQPLQGPLGEQEFRGGQRSLQHQALARAAGNRACLLSTHLGCPHLLLPQAAALQAPQA